MRLFTSEGKIHPSRDHPDLWSSCLHWPLLLSEQKIKVKTKSATHWPLPHWIWVSGIKEAVHEGDSEVFQSSMANRELTEGKLDFEIPSLESRKTACLPNPLL